MKKVKLLWSITFSFGIVLLYATVTSLFVKPDSDWYRGLNMPDLIPAATVISLGWAITYVLTIVLLTRIIYRHDELRSIVAMALGGAAQIAWSIAFFAFKSLLFGVIAELILLILSIYVLTILARHNDNVSFVLFCPILAWYIFAAVSGVAVLAAN